MATSTSSAQGISKSQIEDIKERVPIEDIIKRYVKLKPVGKNLFGQCPFHTEKTPSFSVNPELNIFKCYGCGEGGDAITFLQKIESLEFREAIEMLAKEAGVTLSWEKTDPKQARRITRAKSAHEKAAKYYTYLLTKHASGKNARAYLASRNINTDTIEKFSIGLSPGRNFKTDLVSLLKKESFTPKEIEFYGLAADRYGTTKDRFVDRIMFPIFNASGSIVGFSGRVWKKGDDRPKYINSPESVIFRKRDELFGLHMAKQPFRKDDLAILVEGQTDVILSSMIGIQNVVAPLGTGVTDTQLRKIKKYTNNLAIAFDKDSAGINAHLRVALLAHKERMSTYSIEIPYGNDADEAIRHDPDLFKKAVAQKVPTLTFFINYFSKEHNTQTLEGKRKLLISLMPLLTSLTDEVALDHHLKELHLLTDIPIDVLKEKISDPSTLSASPDEPGGGFKPESLSHETYLLALLFQFPETLSWAAEKIPVEDLQLEWVSDMISLLLNEYDDETELNIQKVLDKLSTDQQQRAEDVIMRPVWTDEPTVDEINEEVNLTIRKIKEHAVRREISSLRKEMSLAEQKNDTESANRTLNIINSKLKELEALQK